MADVTGNGRADIIYACSSCNNEIWVLPAREDGGFDQERRWGKHIKAFRSDSQGFQVVDMNGDGLADFVYDSAGDGKIHVLLSNGEGFEEDDDKERIWGTRDVLYYNMDSPLFRLADVTGNGLPDLIYDGAGIHVLVNKGDGFEKDSVWGLDRGYHVYSRGFRMADVTGNGRADLVYASYNDRNIHVLVNKGDGFDKDLVWGTCAKGYQEYSGGFKMADVTGNGRADVIYDSHDNKDIRVLLSTGRGFGTDTVWGVRSDGYNVSLPGFRMVDLNGSGMADLVYEGAGRKVHVLLSTGSGFMADKTWQTRSESIKNGSVGFQIADIKGSGVPSLIYCSPGATQNVRVFDSHPFPDLVRTVKNPIGGTFNIYYEPSSSYENHYLPYIVQTVKSTEAHDGTGNPPLATHYDYSGGYHDLLEREFRGFETVESKDSFGATTMTAFFQDDVKRGLLARQTVRDGSGNIYKDTLYTYDEIPQGSTQALFPRLIGKDEKTFDGFSQEPPSIHRTTFDYDTYGNVVLRLTGDYTDTPKDLRYEYAEYETNYQFDKWLLSRPSKTYTRAGMGGAGDAESRIDYTYKEDTNLVHTKTLRLREDPLKSPVITYDYDPYGNLASIHDPEGMYPSSGAGYDPTTIAYDEQTRTYPDVIKNPKGRITRKTYDKRFAQTLVPDTLKYSISNQMKGEIGEGLSWLGLTLSGRDIARTQAPNGFGKSTFDFLLST